MTSHFSPKHWIGDVSLLREPEILLSFAQETIRVDQQSADKTQQRFDDATRESRAQKCRLHPASRVGGDAHWSSLEPDFFSDVPRDILFRAADVSAHKTKTMANCNYSIGKVGIALTYLENITAPSFSNCAGLQTRIAPVPIGTSGALDEPGCLAIGAEA